jgi:hypothetical protein
MKKNLIIALSAATLVVGLSGCVQIPSHAGAAPAATGNNVGASPTPTAKSSNPHFGDTKTWKNNVSLTVGAPQPYTLSESGTYAAGDLTGKTVLAFSIKLVNGSDQPLTSSFVYPRVQSGSTEADELYDAANNMDGGPSTDLLPGREADWTEVFAVSNPNDIVFQVSPGFDYSSVYFVS